MSQLEKKFEKEMIRKVQLKYLLHIPKKYDGKKKWPLILFLHGAGERGTDLELVKTHGIAKLVEGNEEFPFITLSPQCPDGVWWIDHLEDLYLLLQEIKSIYAVDDTRIYVTGLSMGGFGTWDLSAKYPDEFAAIAPVCGGTMNKWNIRNLVSMPIWTFHGAKDQTVPISMTQELVDLLKERGNDVTFTIYPDTYHDSHVKAYQTKELYSWFLKYKKEK